MKAPLLAFVADHSRTLKELRHRFPGPELAPMLKQMLDSGELLETAGRYYLPRREGNRRSMPMAEPPKSNGPEPLTADSLRTALWDEIQALRSGKSEPKRANALAKLVDTTLRTVEVEIEARRYRRELEKDGGKVDEEPLRLTHSK